VTADRESTQLVGFAARWHRACFGVARDERNHEYRERERGRTPSRKVTGMSAEQTRLNTHRIAKIQLDFEALNRDLRRAEHFNFSDTYGEFICGAWRNCMLWNEQGDIAETLLSNHDSPAVKTAYGLDMPYVSEWISQTFDVQRLRFARLVKLRPNSVIIPHRDYLELGQGLVRIHVPLITDASCFSSDGEAVYQMKVGEVWFIDATRVHSAASFSQRDRIHLILDFANSGQTSPLRGVPWDRAATIAEDSLVTRSPLTDEEVSALMTLHHVIDQDNATDILALLIRKYFRSRFDAPRVFDLLLRIAELSGNRALHTDLRARADYFLIDRPPPAVTADIAGSSSAATPPPLLDSGVLDHRIAGLIEGEHLGAENNGFFLAAEAVKSVRPAQALAIAHNWREMTKAFMFTTIKGIGVMADQATREARPSEPLLRTIQTMFAVIGDDLNNNMKVFKDVAPGGIAGIHYVWWEDAIINPIMKHCDPAEAGPAVATSPGAARLISAMERLSRSCTGTAVQLRVVEAIALQIAVAFKRVFARIVVDDKKLFTGHDDLAWMNAHIKAEVTHNQQVSDHDVGMASIADTVTKQQEMLAMTAEYVKCWRDALGDFEAALLPDPPQVPAHPAS
jgi:Aspartyl/Asparaginyl beta-hydroxylase/L-proline 3-hydroxylase, C-terminal